MSYEFFSYNQIEALLGKLYGISVTTKSEIRIILAYYFGLQDILKIINVIFRACILIKP